jgi:DNA modification methylase
MSSNNSQTVYSRRNYSVQSAVHAQAISEAVISTWDLDDSVSYGLPEVDDRYHVWRVPILTPESGKRIGEIVIDAKSGVVDSKKSTTVTSVSARLSRENSSEMDNVQRVRTKRRIIKTPELRNTIMLGSSEEMLLNLPSESVQLMFTSPPYFNARPDYTDYLAYDEYLSSLRKVIHEVYRVLEDGRFAVINCSPVLIRRAKRSEASRRIAVPFDIHQIFIQENFEFIDDIIWEKPEGAGWATGRGRRFAADRNPLQYKTVPVTEYVLVYRKKSEKLIDWHIRNHPNQDVVQQSKIADGYEKTNIWKIKPAHCKEHPAIFPVELAEKVIRYYSFIGDVVLDPYAGIGTVGQAAIKSGRRFVLSEKNPEYVDHIRNNAKSWLGKEAENIYCNNCAAIEVDDLLF